MTETLFTFLQAHLTGLSQKLFEQIYLTVLATSAAIVVGIPLGVYAFHKPKLKTIVVAIANILQTIPSLALLAMLIPIFGIGVIPALIALTSYAFLPIIRNTITGLNLVPKHNIEAANSLGFTTWQKLRYVQLPLALPTIVAGIRTATAMSVGIATLAAFVGAGGLGDYINQGLSTNNTTLILLGAIPTAALALLLDFSLAQIELLISQHVHKRSQARGHSLLFYLLLICFCGFFAYQFFQHLTQRNSNNTIRVASKNFTEQIILGELIAQQLQRKTNLHVVKKLNLGSTAICHNAMLKADIDLYPEYTGTAYLQILNGSHNPNMPAQQLYQLLKHRYQKQFGIKWLPVFGFDNTQAVLVSHAFAKHYKLHNISDLKKIENILILGAPSESWQRSDGIPGLKNYYNFNFSSQGGIEVHNMDIGLMYRALLNNSLNIIIGASTDGRIPAYHLQILHDDKNLFPSYLAAPLIRKTVLKQHPEIISALRPLFGLLDNQKMQQLNYQVDILKRSPAVVARDFLQMAQHTNSS